MLQGGELMLTVAFERLPREIAPWSPSLSGCTLARRGFPLRSAGVREAIAHLQDGLHVCNAARPVCGPIFIFAPPAEAFAGRRPAAETGQI